MDGEASGEEREDYHRVVSQTFRSEEEGYQL
jgi:hypothetical protein